MKYINNIIFLCIGYAFFERLSDASLQMRHQGRSFLPERSVPIRTARKTADARPVARRRKTEARAASQRKPGGSAHAIGPAHAVHEPGCQFAQCRARRFARPVIQLRRAHALFPDDLLRRGKVFSGELSGRQDGR